MTGVCHAADAMLEGYLFAQAVAEGNKVNWQHILNETTDPVALFVGLAGIAAHLRTAVAEARGISLAALDEAMIGSLLVEGALS